MPTISVITACTSNIDRYVDVVMTKTWWLTFLNHPLYQDFSNSENYKIGAQHRIHSKL